MSAREIRAPRGTELSCRSWPQEAAMRMLMNNLDPEVAERPEDLVVYGGTGRAARSWEAFDAIVRTLRTLADDETLLVQSGKPVAVFRTHDQAPRVLISNSMLVPKWADWDTFRALEAQGLTMYGQMTAGSWIYIGTQGILQGTYETLAECGTQHFGGLAEGHGHAHGRARRDGRRPAARGHDERRGRPLRRGRPDPDRAPDQDPLPRPRDRRPRHRARVGRRGEGARRRPSRSGCSATAPRCCPSSCAVGGVPTSSPIRRARTIPLGGYVPGGLTLDEAAALRRDDPDEYVRRSYASMAAHVDAMVAFQEAGRGHVRLREQPAGRRGAGRARPRPRVRVPGVRAGVRAAALLRGQGAVPMGGAVGRPGRHPRDRPRGRRALPRERTPPAVAADGRGAGGVPGAARADLLARLRRARPGGRAVQRARGERRRGARRS